MRLIRVAIKLCMSFTGVRVGVASQALVCLTPLFVRGNPCPLSDRTYVIFISWVERNASLSTLSQVFLIIL